MVAAVLLPSRRREVGQRTGLSYRHFAILNLIQNLVRWKLRSTELIHRPSDRISAKPEITIELSSLTLKDFSGIRIFGILLSVKLRSPQPKSLVTIPVVGVADYRIKKSKPSIASNLNILRVSDKARCKLRFHVDVSRLRVFDLVRLTENDETTRSNALL